MAEQEPQVPPSVQINFPEILKDVTNFTGIHQAIGAEAKRLKEQEGVTRIGFVSGGLVNSKDPEEIKQQRIRNSQIMREAVAMFRIQKNIPVFASTDIFDDEQLWKRLEETQPDQQSKLPDKMLLLFQEIINGGITDVFMIPGWRAYPGAVDENETALANPSITIHDPDSQPQL